MADAYELLQLADRCEAASEGSQELDAMVWCADRGVEFLRWDGAGVEARDSDGIFHRAAARVPPVTRDLQAALALVPEGLDWSVDVVEGKPGAEMYQCGGFHSVAHSRAAATPALALVAASLRARAASLKDA